MLIRKAALAIAVVTLGMGPWPDLHSSTRAAGSTWAPVGGMAQVAAAADGGGSRERATSKTTPRHVAARGAPTGCSCREVVINASNVVRDAEVESGDVETINRSITYISPTYEGDDEVEVDQDAEAISGDAVAGQILKVDAGGGCARVRVNATNVVEDAEVRSGDANAENKSLVLVDPRVQKRGDVEIDVDQEAYAESGKAVAGQLIEVAGGGGPCGDTIIKAANRVREVDVISGNATFDNSSQILACKSAGCLDDIQLMLRSVDSVQVCSGDECHDVPVDEFVEMLKTGKVPSSFDDDDDNDDRDDDDEDADDDEDDGDRDDDDDRSGSTKRQRRREREREERQNATETAVVDDTPLEESPPAEEAPPEESPSAEGESPPEGEAQS